MKALKITQGYFVDTWQTEVKTGHILEIPTISWAKSGEEPETSYYFSFDGGISFVKTYRSKVFTILKGAIREVEIQKDSYTEYLLKEYSKTVEKLRELNVQDIRFKPNNNENTI